MIVQRTAGGHPVWRDSRGEVEARFVGRGDGNRREALARAAGASERRLAWNSQVHSARVVDAAAGCCGEGDALFSSDPGLVLSVVTADCVPLLVGGGEQITAVHAGWRGIAAGVVAAALGRFAAPAGELIAWIGPAIGPCCYEVGRDVAERVARASSGGVIAAGAGPRPHLDLGAAVAEQLAEGGVRDVRRVAACTRCEPDRLWSYRRDGPGAGRNLAFIWLR